MNSVGDLESNTRGSGARNNAGKPQMHLIPLTYIAMTIDTDQLDDESKLVHSILNYTGRFQETGDITYLNQALGAAKDYWADCADVFAYGAKKYATWNWVKGMNWSVPLGCIGRHCLKVLVKKEMIDDESGSSHIGHIMCNLVMLKAFVKGFPEGNDLPPKNFTVTVEK